MTRCYKLVVKWLPEEAQKPGFRDEDLRDMYVVLCSLRIYLTVQGFGGWGRASLKGT